MNLRLIGQRTMVVLLAECEVNVEEVEKGML